MSVSARSNHFDLLGVKQCGLGAEGLDLVGRENHAPIPSKKVEQLRLALGHGREGPARFLEAMDLRNDSNLDGDKTRSLSCSRSDLLSRAFAQRGENALGKNE